MRCQCCNRNLDDAESTMRHPETNEFLDICRKCLQDIPITPTGKNILTPDVEYSEKSDWEELLDGFQDEEDEYDSRS